MAVRANNISIHIITWNCRGFRGKRAPLQLLLPTLSPTPQVLLLQDTATQATLPSYSSTHSDTTNAPRASTLVHRALTYKTHYITSDTPCVITEIIHHTHTIPSIFIANIYHPPSQPMASLDSLFRELHRLAGKHPLLIGGDLNSQHTDWGYKTTTHRGRRLWLLMQNLQLSVHNNFQTPTRIGNSVSMDTSPDLVLSRSLRTVTWTRTQHTLGSDHYIIQVTVPFKPPRHTYMTHKLIKWDALRAARTTRADNPITDINDWVESLQTDIQHHTQLIETTTDTPTLDNRLAHLWDAYHSLLERWKRGKHNRTLKKRLATLQSQIQIHSEELCRSNWGQVCDDIAGRLTTKRAWHLLRHLLDPSHTKTTTQHHVTRLIHAHMDNPNDLLDTLRDTYTSPGIPTSLPSYTGQPNAELDTDITEAEVRAALLTLRTKSAPGADLITNTTLRNLDDKSITRITEYFNQCWKEGTLPQSWRHAKVMFIPKPNKPLTLQNLRPISLTSCLGKLFEHVVLARLSQHMTDRDLYPHSMVGFRPHLSTQDAMLQITHDIFDPLIPGHTKAVLALDLSKAFDRVEHHAILTALSPLNVGTRTYTYIQAFLTARTAELQFGPLTHPTYTLKSVGTPQGSVLSPFLFNITLIPLARQLATVPHLKHTLYADDITLWSTHGSDGDIQDTIQTAANLTQNYAVSVGLTCSPEKSGLLCIRPKSRNSPSPPIVIELDGRSVPEVDTLRILGMHIQSDGKNTNTIRRLKQVAGAISHLIRRVSGRYRGMKEGDLCRLIHAFVLSRVLYCTPYLQLSRRDTETLDALIRRAYKVALHLPISTPTDRLLKLGLHNTIGELIDAHRQAQYLRLTQTDTGRHILHSLGIQIPANDPTLLPIPRPLHRELLITPLPRNMHPDHHDKRRRARAKTLHLCYGAEPDAVWVDAACVGDEAVAAVVDHNLSPIGTHTLPPDTSPEAAEEAAIALAIVNTEARYVLSDSKTAILNFARGRVHVPAFCILDSPAATPPRQVELIWVPAHCGNPGNEAANLLARGSLNRAPAASDLGFTKDRAHTFNELTQAYRAARQLYPPPHKSLSNRQATLWRQLQTHTLPSPLILSHYHPLFLTSACTLCPEPHASAIHILSHCPADPPPRALEHLKTWEDWETLLRSEDPVEQTMAADRAASVMDHHQMNA